MELDWLIQSYRQGYFIHQVQLYRENNLTHKPDEIKKIILKIWTFGSNKILGGPVSCVFWDCLVDYKKSHTLRKSKVDLRYE